MKKVFLLALPLIFTIYSSSIMNDYFLLKKEGEVEISMNRFPHVRINVDPVTKEIVPFSVEKHGRGAVTHAPPIIYNEVVTKNGVGILEPNFKPTNYLFLHRDCINQFEVSHSKNKPIDDCSTSPDRSSF